MDDTMNRYHVMLGTKRTTVTMDSIVSEFLALHLGADPHSSAGHTAVRQWAQDQLDANNDPGRIRTSQWLLARAVETLARPSLAEKHGAWSDSILSRTLAKRRVWR